MDIGEIEQPIFVQVHDVKQFWNWTERVVVPNLYTEADYRGYPLPDGGSRIISTMAAYRVGPVRLRQHRVIRGKKLDMRHQRCFVSLAK